jgi:hypothetical protein
MTSIKSRLNDAIFFEKMTENQAQLIVQMIHISQDFISTEITVTDWTAWHYIKLSSIIITAASLARTCSRYEFNRHELNPRLFSFYCMGSGWTSFYPQYLILLLVQTSLVVSKILSLLYITIIVQLDLLKRSQSRNCSLEAAVKSADSLPSCGFVLKALSLILLYKVSYYGLVSILALPRCLYLVGRDIVKLWGSSLDLRRRLRESVAVLRFPFNLVSSQRNFMSSRIFINHLPKNVMMTVIVKIGPSILHSMGTVIFAAVFCTQNSEDFHNIDFGFDPMILPFIGLGIDVIHLISLILWVFWIDPQHVRSLSDEKMLDLLLRMNKVPVMIEVLCSKTAKDIIREIIAKDESFDVSKEIVEVRIVKMNIQSPMILPQQSTLIEKLRFKIKQASLKSSECNSHQGKPINYRKLSEEDRMSTLLDHFNLKQSYYL